MRLLLVEDDELLSAGLRDGLTRHAYVVDHLTAAEPAQTALSLISYDAAIVDIGLPGIDGLELIRRWRRRGVTTPVLVLTARDGLEDRVSGLDLGADDYMVKPFQLPELLARLRALIRRSRSASSSELLAGKVRLDLAARTVTVAGAPLELTGREFELLAQLMMASPKVVAKKQLAESLSAWENELTLNAIELYVSRLRAKLSDAGINIRTLRGIGYRLDESVHSDGEA